MSQPFSAAQAAILGILVLMVIAVLLGLYIFYHRGMIRRFERYVDAKRSEWLPVVFDYLGGDDSAALEVKRLVTKKDHDPFTDHMLEVLDSVEGDDVERLRVLCNELGICTSYRKALGSVSKSRWAKIHAAHFLGELRETDAEAALVELLDDDRLPLVLASARAIAQLGNLEHLPEVLSVVANLEGPSEEAVAEILLDFGPAMAPDLEQLLESEDLSPREESIVIDLLAELRHYAAVPALCRAAAQTQHLPVELKAIRALGKLADPEGLPLVASKGRSPIAEVRAEAAKAIGFIGEPQGGGALAELLGDDDWKVRYNAAWGMIHLGGDAERELRALAGQPVRDVVMCRQVLGEYDAVGSEAQ